MFDCKGMRTENRNNYKETYAPIIRYNSLKYLFWFAVKHLDIDHLDVDFLQGDLDKEIYVKFSMIDRKAK